MLVMQNSFTAAESASTQPNAHTLLSFDTLLDHSRPSWQGSVDGLYDTLFHGSLNSGNGESKTHYVLNMARVLGSLSLEARRGVESCLLYIMRRVRGVNGDDFFDDSQPTPDYLLASIHGD